MSKDYYSDCAVPKPKERKPKKKINGFKEKPNRLCYYTRSPGAERHEIFGGPNRQTSIDQGFQVDLCPEYHREFHKHTPWAQKEELRWKIYYQFKYEQKLIDKGLEPERARRTWMHLIGENNLGTIGGEHEVKIEKEV